MRVAISSAAASAALSPRSMPHSDQSLTVGVFLTVTASPLVVVAIDEVIAPALRPLQVDVVAGALARLIVVPQVVGFAVVRDAAVTERPRIRKKGNVSCRSRSTSSRARCRTSAAR